MNERLEHKPLTKQERFVLNALSTGLTKDDLLVRVERTAKVPDNEVFPSYFGRNGLDVLIKGLLDRGLIKEIFETSEKGKSELSQERKFAVRTPAPLIHPIPRRAEPFEKPTSRPVPLPRIAEPFKEPQSKKKKKEERLTLEELGKRKDEFKPG